MFCTFITSMIINRPILHSFDIFDMIHLTSNWEYQ